MFKLKSFLYLLMLVGVCFLSACDLIEKELASASEAETTASAAAELLSSIPEMQSLVAYEPAPMKKTFFLNKAYANTNCFNSSPSCVDNGDGTSGYVRALSNCELSQELILNGSIAKKYNNSTCSLVNQNEEATRDFTKEITGYGAFTLSAKTGAHKTYDGTSLTGGQVLSNQGGGSLSYTTFGVRRLGEVKYGTKIFDITTRTPTPILIDISGGSLDKYSLSSGAQIQIFNNILEYKVTLNLSNISWTNNCTCPTKGTLNGDSQGSKVSNMMINFDTGSCNSAKFSFEGESKEVSLDTCLAL